MLLEGEKNKKRLSTHHTSCLRTVRKKGVCSMHRYILAISSHTIAPMVFICLQQGIVCFTWFSGAHLELRSYIQIFESLAAFWELFKSIQELITLYVQSALPVAAREVKSSSLCTCLGSENRQQHTPWPRRDPSTSLPQFPHLQNRVKTRAE